MSPNIFLYTSEKYARAPGKAAMAWQFFPARAYFERGLDLEIQGGGGRRNQGQGHQKQRNGKKYLEIQWGGGRCNQGQGHQKSKEMERTT